VLCSRAEALRNVESTIVELGTIFNKLSEMVASQTEMAVRIDENIDEVRQSGRQSGGVFLLLSVRDSTIGSAVPCRLWLPDAYHAQLLPWLQLAPDCSQHYDEDSTITLACDCTADVE
jgi:hypothetical protein